MSDPCNKVESVIPMKVQDSDSIKGVMVIEKLKISTKQKYFL